VAATGALNIEHAAFDAAIASWPGEHFSLRPRTQLLREHPGQRRRLQSDGLGKLPFDPPAITQIADWRAEWRLCYLPAGRGPGTTQVPRARLTDLEISRNALMESQFWGIVQR